MLACFKWQDTEHQLLMMQAREDRKLKRAAWWNEDEDTKDIVGDRDEKSRGTWFGCSKQGRVALLINVTPSRPLCNAGAELLTVKFLKGEMTPMDFANQLQMDENLSSGLTFILIVADIHSRKMFYISKKTQNKKVDEIKEVGPGSYCISSDGIHDLSIPGNICFQDAFSELIKNELSKKECFKKLMSDEIMVKKLDGEIDTSTAVTKQEKKRKSHYNSPGSNGTSQLEVKPTGKANFFVTYWENGEYEKSLLFDFEIE